MAQSINIAVRCPECKWRVMDKVSPTTGKIEIKCPHCHKTLQVKPAECPKHDLNGEKKGGCQIVGLPLAPIMDGILWTVAPVIDDTVLDHPISWI